MANPQTTEEQQKRQRDLRYADSLREELYALKNAGVVLRTTRNPPVILVEGLEYSDRDERVQISRWQEKDPNLEIDFRRSRELGAGVLLSYITDPSGEVSLIVQDDEGYAHSFHILRRVLDTDLSRRVDARAINIGNIFQD